ncbi:Vacuolar protein sorting-associated protein 17 [Rhizopus stolonifer]|uniref:Vacuolar protein sorting-associated protein 17 n=1 Tax=Rhizopus stolonifer TaxID=4846 RepID=A0A367ITQ5_RHIST|nr:Vacuolar protein sorting-associated protein 17 [Rhizopus stolonifer]
MSCFLQFLITNVDYKRKDPVFWINVETTLNKYKQRQKRIPRYYSELEKLHSHLVFTLEDVLIPALPFCPLPRFDKDGNLVQKQWWLNIKLPRGPQDQTIDSADPLEYKIQLWLNRIAEHERIQQSEGLREFVESEVGFRPNLHKLSKPLSTHITEQDVDPEYAFWTILLKSLSSHMQHCLTQNDKTFHEHRVMADHLMELSFSFVSYGAMERDPELFMLYKSIAKGFQQMSDIQRLQALAVYETTGIELSYQLRNVESTQNALQRKLTTLSEYLTSKRHTESSLRAVERLKSSVNINREQANEAIAILESARTNENVCLQHYKNVDENIRDDIEYKYKSNVTNDLKNTLKEYVKSQLYLEKKKLEVWQEILNENKVDPLQ